MTQHPFTAFANHRLSRSPGHQAMRPMPERCWATFTAGKSTRHVQDQTGIKCPRPLCLGTGCTRSPNRPRTFPIA